jgi:hypothetical protein
MVTQNRYYSNLSQGTFLTNTGGVGPSTSAVTVQATANWPTSYPFAVRFEPGTSNEEVGLVISGLGVAGNPFEIQRGYDNTTPSTHSQGTSIVPGFCQLDFAEPQMHINQNSASSLVNGIPAHGLPTNAWGGGTTQLLGTYPASAASGTLINIPSIPGTFNHLRLEYALQGNGTSAGGIGSVVYADYLTMRFNGVSTSNYQGISTYVAGLASSTALNRQVNGSAFVVGAVWIQNPSTSGAGRGYIDIPAYADNTNVKSATYQGIATDGGADIVIISGGGGSGSASSTSPVSSIQLIISGSSSGYVAGDVWLYGIT